MSTLYLVRHGQASFGQSDYDQLSELGERQARRLGEYWLRQGVSLDAVYSGTLRRQIQSAEGAAAVYRTAGRPWPGAAAWPEFNEYDTKSLLTSSFPKLVAEHPELGALLRELNPGSAGEVLQNRKLFQRVFSAVMERWVDGRFQIPGMESWSEFAGRVNRGLSRLMQEQGSGKTVAVFTSGGPISVAMQRALGTSDQTALELGWVIPNGSVSEFRWSQEKFSLVSFNSVPHLTEPGLLSYR